MILFIFLCKISLMLTYISPLYVSFISCRQHHTTNKVYLIESCKHQQLCHHQESRAHLPYQRQQFQPCNHLLQHFLQHLLHNPRHHQRVPQWHHRNPHRLNLQLSQQAYLQVVHNPVKCHHLIHRHQHNHHPNPVQVLNLHQNHH